jgi:hypothetical protein
MHAVRICGNGYCQNLGLNFDSNVCPGKRQAIGERRERKIDTKKKGCLANTVRRSVSALALFLSHVLLAALNSSASPHLLALGAHLHTLHAFRLLASLHLLALGAHLHSLHAFRLLASLHLLALGAHLHSLHAFRLLPSLHATTGLHVVSALLARLNAVYSFARLTPLSAFAALNSL